MSVAPPSNTSTSFLILFLSVSESLPTRNCNFGGTQIVITDLSNNIFIPYQSKVVCSEVSVSKRKNQLRLRKHRNCTNLRHQGPEGKNTFYMPCGHVPREMFSF